MLNAKNFGLAGGIVYGLLMLALTLLAVAGVGTTIAGIYVGVLPGFAISVAGAVIGLIHGFISGFITFYLIAYVYNMLGS